MRPLRITVPLGRGETPPSFASRLALANGLSVRDLCLDFGTTFKLVISGDSAALAVIAAKGGVTTQDLKEHAFFHTARQQYSYREHILTRTDLRRTSIYVCPECIASDLRDRTTAARVAPFGRAIWQIAAIKTCSIHETSLVQVEHALASSKLHDFSFTIGPAVLGIDALRRGGVIRPQTSFERYVENRVQGQASQSHYLDKFNLQSALLACELFGTYATLGMKNNMRQMSDEQWREAGRIGFEIFADGERGAIEFLEGLPRPLVSNGSFRAHLGGIFHVISERRTVGAVRDLEDFIRDYILSHYPIDPGKVVLGTRVERRLVHSVLTLSRETGLHPIRLRKLLKAAGVLPPSTDGLKNAHCVFPAELGDKIGDSALNASLSLRRAAEYINAPPAHRDLLYKSGLLIPGLSGKGVRAQSTFYPSDLDDFLQRLLSEAVEISTTGPKRLNIPDTAKRACCSAVEIVRLILDNSLSGKWRLSSERGYLSVLVDLDEVREHVKGPENDTLSIEATRQRWKTTANVVRALIRHNYLATVDVINPLNRCPVKAIPIDSIERFEQTYVSLYAMTRLRKVHYKTFIQSLEAGGIFPAVAKHLVGAAFYLRGEVLSFLPETPQILCSTQRDKPRALSGISNL